MSYNREYLSRILRSIILMLTTALSGFAGVSRAIQEQYRQDYENKAMFLKIPIYSERQMIYISGQNFRVDQGTGTPRYKVGDQLRVYQIDFSGDAIRFKMGEIASPASTEIEFKFDTNLQEDFPNKDVFDRALQSTLTAGLKYTEIEDAKNSFIEEQFERSVREIAAAASASSDSVLKRIAPHVPAYQDAQGEIETLKNRVEEVSGQLSRSQAEDRRMQAELKTQQNELAGLKNDNAALQRKIDNSASQVSKLGEELNKAKGTAQGYQKELASIQRSLNIRVDPSRDLSMQIADLGQAMLKLQKDNETQAQQISSLRTSLGAQEAANARLVRENEELKSDNLAMQSTIKTLTSKEDSLARQYLDLKNEKEKLDDFSQSIGSLSSRLVEEKTEDGVYYGKANIYLGNALLGFLDWNLPVYLNHGQSKNVEANFSAESIDTVQMTPEERHILRSLGEPLKIKLNLASGSPTMNVTPGKGEPVHEIGERDHSTWQWSINNQGTQDSQVLLTARLINKDSNEIPLFQQEHAVAASNAVRQVRRYLQPIPLAAGAVLGFLLFGIVGIFKRTKSSAAPSHKSSSGSSASTPYGGQKQL
jgi:predicted nuclease with TOPRIM domain